METTISQSKRKMWVTINYAALASLLAAFYTVERSSLTAPLIVWAAVSALLLVISFVMVYARTRLWRFVHTSPAKLDEREIMVTYESLRHSYAVFAVICLAIFLVAELFRDDLLVGYEIPLMPVFGALIYLAHILPASVIAWREREIYRD